MIVEPDSSDVVRVENCDRTVVKLETYKVLPSIVLPTNVDRIIFGVIRVDVFNVEVNSVDVVTSDVIRVEI